MYVILGACTPTKFAVLRSAHYSFGSVVSTSVIHYDRKAYLIVSEEQPGLSTTLHSRNRSTRMHASVFSVSNKFDSLIQYYIPYVIVDPSHQSVDE